jgi:DNA processing protein
MGELVEVAFGLRSAGGLAVARTQPRQLSLPSPAPEKAARPRGPEGLSERQRLWWRIWSAAPGIGWLRLQELAREFHGLDQAWQASPEALRRALGRSTRLGERGLATLLAYRTALGPSPLSDPISAEQRQRWRGERVLVVGDAALPGSLRQLERPPLQVYWQGRGSLWPCLRRRQAVAVVGTRHPSRQGESLARAIGRALAEAGWPVVSGLAEGIDAAAHRGCLEGGGRPVGILGTPLERVYPRHHDALQEQVGREGLLVSEQAPGSPVRAGHFAARNRLQVALAQAVVLVECPHGSGALHSARLAWNTETPLWVVPADVGRASAAGSNSWLAQGASVLLDPADLIRNLGPGPLQAAGAPDHPRVQGMLEREAALLAALGAGASLDQLCQRLRQDSGRISERLLQLEMAGLVRSQPGLWWQPC